MSAEIVELCQKHGCSTLFMENLSWLESQGGKWNHSAQQNAIELHCAQRGIATYKVNAKNTSKEHPVTGELGKELGRNIVWSTGDLRILWPIILKSQIRHYQAIVVHVCPRHI